MAKRTSKMSRETGETQISVEVNLDGEGSYKIDTGNGMFDHMLAQLSRHGLIDLNVTAKGDTHVGWHHTVEDTGIVLGRALKEAVGDGAGITRMAHTYVPLDEALALVVVDYSGRGYAVIDANLTDSDMGDMPASLVTHFLETLSREGGFNLHVKVLAGANNHHKAEAIFKALARSLRAALTLDARRAGDIPSTKGTIG
ncbi:MAG: imidazoleglycerol-phosphate dehydratase HisB [Chloroflexi bacterium]|nr:imidazoleglycerol-phosphate dehydratase HisB [Chloroflexota bacterium]MDA1228628.1 imidazoleglycerol-phosphate dehydratase HisB [Chloroflexota bacterium]